MILLSRGCGGLLGSLAFLRELLLPLSSLFWLNEFLGRVCLEEAEVHPEDEADANDDSPRDPYIGGGLSIKNQISSTMSVLVGEEGLGGDDSDSKTSVASLNRVMFTLHSVPGSHVLVALSEGNISESEPEQKSGDGEKVLGRHKDSVHHEEVHQELNAQKELSVAESTEQSVTKDTSSS